MKNKSTRHKNENTFKFEPFADRISKIDIDIFHRVAHEYETEEENQCYFYQAVEKWNILNLTDGYANFKKEVRYGELITLPQLILHKARVVDTLKKHLKLKNVLCLQPLLELTVAVAQDLRKEFYPYFPDILEILFELLNTKDTEQLEWTFQCLAYLFKYAWQSLVKDIGFVLKLILPLLSDSKPEYINHFAAGSFAFVARKVKDRPTFLGHILKFVDTRKDGIEGCGKLFFEAIHGIQGQFHSSAEATLLFLFNSLFEDNKYPKQILYDILVQVIVNIGENIRPQNSNELWKALLDTVTELSAKSKNFENGKRVVHLEMILKLLGSAIEEGNGKLLKTAAPVVAKISQMMKHSEFPESTFMILVQISVLLLIQKRIQLTQEEASSLIRSALSVSYEAVFLFFIDYVSDIASFEALVLPSFLKHCCKTDLNNETFKVLTKLVLKKAPLCGSGIKFSTWSKYALDFGSSDSNQNVKNIIEKFVSIEDFGTLFEVFDSYFSSLVCLPHLKLTDHKSIVDKLRNNVLAIVEIINSSDPDNLTKLKQYMFALNVTLETLLHFGCSEFLIENFENLTTSLLKFSNKIEMVASLKTLDLIFSMLKDDNTVIKYSTLLSLNDVLADNFCSPYHELRLLTSHIYSLFEDLPEFDLKYSLDPEAPKHPWKIFSICYNVESTEPTVHTYRDQLLQLNNFEFDKPQMLMCKDTEFKCIPLRYLCGALYINFSLLWQPTLKIIESHAHGLDVQQFWDVYGAQLREAVMHTKNDPTLHEDTLETACSYLNDLYDESQQLKSVPDFVNYRLLLWKGMTEFADVAEAKTRDVSELFLDFMESEYVQGNYRSAIVWNIRQNIENKESNPNETNEETKMDEDMEDAENDLSDSSTKLGVKSKLQMLIASLSVFSKVKSPKSMYRENELHQIYFDLLSHRKPDVQKGALNCLLTYKYKYLVPYKTNLLNVIDDKNFKNELATFHVDQECQLIQPEHRPDLMPIIMRIVYSKMSTKTGLRTRGKSPGQTRRNLVLRFLMGCTESEMIEFVTMAFKLYSSSFNDDPVEMVNAISSTVDLEKVTPPKRLQSAVNLLSVIFDYLGGLMGDKVLKYLLDVLLVIGATVKGICNQISDVHSGYMTLVRQLRTSSIKLVEEFFERFEKFPWTTKQIDAVFSVFVWPYIDKLNTEGIHSPSTLLKLFIQWGSNPTYFPLLVKHFDDNKDQYVLPHVIKLFLNEKSHLSVLNAIEGMLEKLLTLKIEEEDSHQAIPVANLLPVENDILARIKVDENLNYGSCILLPFVPSILDLIKRKLSSKSKYLNQRELFILSRISELVWESDISDTVLNLLLPLVLKKVTGHVEEDVALQYMTTVNNLIGNVSDPSKHIKNISPLFSELDYVSCRKILMTILEKMAQISRDDMLQKAFYMMNELNAWDAKWVDQPDFARRHEAFKEVNKYIEEGSIDMSFGVLLIYNSYFLIRTQKDLALKENSIYCLKALCPLLINKFKGSQKDIDYLLNSTLFDLIRKGMRSREDDVRNECITLLGHLARECADSHFILRDLNLFTNKADPEVDFFSNIVHLQLHRHARALLKFCQLVRELTVSLNVRTLTQFVLPLVSHYLCNDKFVGKNSVIDAAIEATGVISRMLPWHQYEALLKYYLSKLQRKLAFQRQLVRLIVAILDSFHFDLSKGIVTDIKPESKETGRAGGTESSTGVDVEEKEKDVASKGTPMDVDESKGNNENDGQDEEMDVDEELGDNMEEESEEEKDESEENNDDATVKICEKITILCKSTATRVIKAIQIVLLPKLHKSLAEMTQVEGAHKVNRKKTSIEQEEEDMLRVPISLAVVKLLQRLPKEILDHNLPGVFMKLCTFLRSHLESVRRVARETLEKIMNALGPEYLKVLLSEMPPLLSRGYQVHVLVFTIHGVLSSLKELYKPTHIDEILLTVLDLCRTDLFGALSDEKEVLKIQAKVSEAKSTKSYDTLRILAQFITDKCLLDLVVPLKEVLQATHSHKVKSKAQEALRKIAEGLIDNTFVSVESLMKFAYGTASESIPELLPKEKQMLSEKERQWKERRGPDCYIIPKAPSRAGFKHNTSVSSRTNAHLLVEFGLRLCHMLLKRDKLKDERYRPFVDPFIAVFRNCLTSQHIELCTLSLNCLRWAMKYDLPSLRSNIGDITPVIFDILHKYASADLSKGNNYDLVVAAFKAMAVLVRDVKYQPIKNKDIRVLLLYVEQDMHDFEKQATAFDLLRAIISRRIVVKQLHGTMQKVAELSIVSESDRVRAQARSVVHHYVTEVATSAGRQGEVLQFFGAQLRYHVQSGRESALETLQLLVGQLPEGVLATHAPELMARLGLRLVQEQQVQLVPPLMQCLTQLLARLDRPTRDQLFDVCVGWMAPKQPLVNRNIAVRLCELICQVETLTFESRLKKLLPLIKAQFGMHTGPGRLVRVYKEETDTHTNSETQEMLLDRLLYVTLTMMVTIAKTCPSFLKHPDVESLIAHVQTLLGYPEAWVRIGAAQFINYVLTTVDVKKLSKLYINDEREDCGYPYSDPESYIPALARSLCDQLQEGVISELLEEVVKGLVMITRIVQDVPVKSGKLNLLWLVKEMRRAVNAEIVENSSSISVRKEIFSWIGCVLTILDVEKIKTVAHHLLAPLVREWTAGEKTNAELKEYAKEAGNIMKKKVGLEFYTSCLTRVEQDLLVRRAERKRARAQLVITHPEISANKKIKHSEKKKEAKKRKISAFKGRMPSKVARKREHYDVTDY